MAEEFSEADMNKALFLNLVMMFSATAMQQMGKLVNPATGKAETDLHGAQVSIDILTMLAAKTKGNLDKDEERLLTDTISSVQMNYVQTAESASRTGGAKREAEEEKKAGAVPPAQGPEAADAGRAGPDAGGDARKAPKFHKTYGEG